MAGLNVPEAGFDVSGKSHVAFAEVDDIRRERGLSAYNNYKSSSCNFVLYDHNHCIQNIG